jgi:glucose-6-phosphate isomerase
MVLYVPGRWAHRSINIEDDEDLVTLFAYPANAGHDYVAIETKGFRKLIIEENSKPKIIDNPKWKD